MSRAQKYVRSFTLLVLSLAATQVAVSSLVKTHRMRVYLISHLERAFGRPVDAGSFSFQVLPIPQLFVDSVTIGEDPSFGHEYFLRAETMAASLRLSGIFRGRFEFGTMSFTRPSLILVRNSQGRWNLEDWLPPANTSHYASSSGYGPQPSPESTHHLQKIQFDDGRINFKLGDEKRPFAFTNVSGTVEQLDEGRWQLQLEAQPWRSGVGLQSAGVLQVRGDVAGTSSRLQPAQIQVHWDKASLADLFRLATGNDPGIRGELSLDGQASVGKPLPGEPTAPGRWRFNLQARTTQLHRWDLTERSDNPNVNLHVKGIWDLVAGEVRADTIDLDSPHSRLRASGQIVTNAPADWHVRVGSAAVQAQDLLAWCRAFQPNIDEDISADQLFAGSGELHGWPIQWDSAEVATRGGILLVPGLAQPVQIDPFRGSLSSRRFMLQPVRVMIGSQTPASPAKSKSEKALLAKTRPGAASENTIESVLLEDFSTGEGVLRLYLRLANVTPAFKIAAAFGHPLNRGWELTGGAGGRVELGWQRGLHNRHWRGSFDLSKAALQAAGLNLPLKLDDVHLQATDTGRSATLTHVSAFGGIWSGSIAENTEEPSLDSARWHFQLHSDLLDAAELDRWFGPRARPSWLQRLLPALLSKSDSEAKPSELMRRVSAEGEISVDTLIVEKVKLAHASGKVALHDLHLDVHDAEAQWAGGIVIGNVKAAFSPGAQYDVNAAFTRVNLAQLPWTPRWAERWSGAVNGQVHLTTVGVGREELLEKLAGHGEIKLNGVEFRGWDVPSSVESGTVHTGTSRWTTGEGEITLAGRNVALDSIKLDTPHGKTELTGTIGFGQDGKLTFTPALPENRTPPRNVPARRTLQVSGPLDTPVVVVEPISIVAAPVR
jgi:hypothetical protein